MFDDLNSIDWAKLSQGYGTAEAVPEHIRALVSDSEDERDNALMELWENLVHQGTRFEASPYAVPFLFEALEAPDCRIRHRLIDLLLSLAVGLGDTFLPAGYDLEEEERLYGHRDVWPKLFEQPQARDAYHAVLKRADLFVKYLDRAYDPETRLSAGFALAHFADPLSDSHDRVDELIRQETDEDQLQSLTLTFGMLGRFADPQPDGQCLSPYLSADATQMLRVCAAIAAITMRGEETPEPVVQLLFQALSEARPLKPARDIDIWWNEGDLLGYAALACKLLGNNRREEVARALCGALQADACSFAVPQTLLDILFPEPKPPEGRNVSQFDELQLAALQTLLKSPHWTNWMIDSAFLPPNLVGEDYQNALQSFIKDVTQQETEFDLRREGNVSSWDFKRDGS